MKDEQISKFATVTRKLRAVATVLLGILMVLLAEKFHDTESQANESYTSFFIRIAQNFSKEVGFALIVAVVIWAVFEYFAREENEEMWKARIRDISENIFYGVLRRKLPVEYIQLANEVVLSPKFIRTDWQLDIFAKDSNFGRDFVEFNIRSRFKITNVTDDPHDFPFDIGVPIVFDPSGRLDTALIDAGARRDGNKISVDVHEKNKQIESQTSAIPSFFKQPQTSD